MGDILKPKTNKNKEILKNINQLFPEATIKKAMLMIYGFKKGMFWKIKGMKDEGVEDKHAKDIITAWLEKMLKPIIKKDSDGGEKEGQVKKVKNDSKNTCGVLDLF